jgi:hypothetical protein
MSVMNNGNIVVGDTMGHVVWFSSDGQVLKSDKGGSAVVSLKIDDSSDILVVAR